MTIIWSRLFEIYLIMIICDYLSLNFDNYLIIQKEGFDYLIIIWDYLVIIWDYWSFFITNNYQIMVMLFDDYSIVISMPIIPIIQIAKAKCEYLVPFWQTIVTPQQLLFDDYLMIICWLFEIDYLIIIIIICIIWIIWFI